MKDNPSFEEEIVLAMHIIFGGGRCILGDPGAASRDDRMLVVKAYYKNGKSPGRTSSRSVGISCF